MKKMLLSLLVLTSFVFLGACSSSSSDGGGGVPPVDTHVYTLSYIVTANAGTVTPDSLSPSDFQYEGPSPVIFSIVPVVAVDGAPGNISDFAWSGNFSTGGSGGSFSTNLPSGTNPRTLTVSNLTGSGKYFKLSGSYKGVSKEVKVTLTLL